MLQRLRSLDPLKTSVIVGLVENNYGFYAVDTMRNVLAEYQPSACYNPDPRKEGVATTSDTKEAYVDTAMSYFRAQKLHMVSYKDSVNHPYISDNTRRALQTIEPHLLHPRFKDMMKTQLLNFRRIVEYPKDAQMHQPRITYTGKNKAGTQQDDVAIALMMCLYYALRAINDINFTQALPRTIGDSAIVRVRHPRLAAVPEPEVTL